MTLRCRAHAACLCLLTVFSGRFSPAQAQTVRQSVPPLTEERTAILEIETVFCSTIALLPQLIYGILLRCVPLLVSNAPAAVFCSRMHCHKMEVRQKAFRHGERALTTQNAGAHEISVATSATQATRIMVLRT